MSAQTRVSPVFRKAPLFFKILSFWAMFWFLIGVVLTVSRVVKADESFHSLSTAHGISAPSYNTSVFTNPAGLTYNEHSRISAFAENSAVKVDHPTAGAGLLTGDGKFGGTLGLKQTTSSPAQSSLFYGGGYYVSDLKVAFGVSGLTALNGGGGTTLNGGILLFPRGDLKFGYTAFDFTGGVLAHGFGVAFDIERTLTLAGDLIYVPHGKDFYFRPGLRWGSSNIYATVSYNFRRGSSLGGIGSTADGPSLGLGLYFSQSVSWQIYYKQINTLFTGLTFDI